jgi:MFS family permease
MLRFASYSFPLLLIAFSLARSAAFAYPILLGVGFTMILNNATANATLQHIVPNELRGRMMAAYSFIVVGLSSVVGSLIGGSVAHAIGVSWAIGGAAFIMLVYAYRAFERNADLQAI